MTWTREGRLWPSTGWLLVLLVWFGECLSAKGAAEGNDGKRTFYVDSDTGRDSDDGQSPDHAWRSLDRVNAAELKPGDTVRFRSGGVWRGSLVPASGDQRAPVTYTSFGQGPKPIPWPPHPHGTGASNWPWPGTSSTKAVRITWSTMVWP